MSGYEKKENIILGGGIAGVTAGHTLKQYGKEVMVYDRNQSAGGLCRSFCIDGFTFDTFAHVNFSKDKYVMSMLEEKTPFYTYVPEAVNYYKGKWIRNPAQNNLIDLEIEERIKIIKDFINKKEIPVNNYDDWLRYQYGNYFTDNFPTRYTRKYWTVEPNKLGTRWVEGRMYQPTIDEVLRGAMTKATPNVHYTKEIHYPVKGGYQAFMNPFTEELPISLNRTVIGVNTEQKIVEFQTGVKVKYRNLISTIPLNELIACMEDVPKEIKKAADELDYTSGVLVSIGLRRENVAPALWFYIYDEDIWPARVYAPNIKSPQNVPSGCCALQAEIYFSKYRPCKKNLEELKEETITQLVNMGLFLREDIVVSDVRAEPYANIMFTPKVYSARDKIHKYLKEKEIVCAGRFGEWDYLWTGQAIMSGKKAAEKLIRVG
ncbi:protoporphyrinogen/coproporphyrinogen oxidase [Parablautia muri]|uniref:Amine oxidase domain-containing protein n=1 Tax=Parablautia muri TaxID=2320879 RepID=A0A9X5BEU1_9FIRM|nr:FAD-dependent oxidoreductase [Parablautia muri]NBJ92496.1 hypothetical protein [Parablautia muri]